MRLSSINLLTSRALELFEDNYMSIDQLTTYVKLALSDQINYIDFIYQIELEDLQPISILDRKTILFEIISLTNEIRRFISRIHIVNYKYHDLSLQKPDTLVLEYRSLD